MEPSSVNRNGGIIIYSDKSTVPSTDTTSAPLHASSYTAGLARPTEGTGNGENFQNSNPVSTPLGNSVAKTQNGILGPTSPNQVLVPNVVGLASLEAYLFNTPTQAQTHRNLTPTNSILS